MAVFFQPNQTNPAVNVVQQVVYVVARRSTTDIEIANTRDWRALLMVFTAVIGIKSSSRVDFHLEDDEILDF